MLDRHSTRISLKCFGRTISSCSSLKMLKVAVIISLIALVLGQGHRYGGYGGPALVRSHVGDYGGGHGGYGGGYGGAAHDYAQPTPYEYGYDIAGGDHHSGEFKQTRKESGDGHGNVQGSYGYTDSHGNYRQVDYVADGHGFRAQVKTNEPGTDQQSPADAHFQVEPSRHGGYGGGYEGRYSGPHHGRY